MFAVAFWLDLNAVEHFVLLNLLFNCQIDGVGGDLLHGDEIGVSKGTQEGFLLSGVHLFELYHQLG
jgi:hypothetical protein